MQLIFGGSEQGGHSCAHALLSITLTSVASLEEVMSGIHIALQVSRQTPPRSLPLVQHSRILRILFQCFLETGVSYLFTFQ